VLTTAATFHALGLAMLATAALHVHVGTVTAPAAAAFGFRGLPATATLGLRGLPAALVAARAGAHRRGDRQRRDASSQKQPDHRILLFNALKRVVEPHVPPPGRSAGAARRPLLNKH
jgi:hypothetical protein